MYNFLHKFARASNSTRHKRWKDRRREKKIANWKTSSKEDGLNDRRWRTVSSETELHTFYCDNVFFYFFHKSHQYWYYQLTFLSLLIICHSIGVLCEWKIKEQKKKTLYCNFWYKRHTNAILMNAERFSVCQKLKAANIKTSNRAEEKQTRKKSEIMKEQEPNQMIVMKMYISCTINGGFSLFLSPCQLSWKITRKFS